MTQFDLQGKAVRSLSFDSDGIYSVSSDCLYNVNYWELEDSEIKTFQDNIKKINNSPILDNDTIYFEKHTTFPKLLLNKLNLNIKRTIKVDKSTKIIMNPDKIIQESDVSDNTSGYLITVGNDENQKFNQVFFIKDSDIAKSESEGISLELMQKFFIGNWIKVTALPSKITSELIHLINSNANKITTVYKLAEYLNSNLPKLDNDSAETIVNLFKSGQEEKKLALNMVTSFNISNIIYDICDALGKSGIDFDYSTKNSINYKYFKLLLNCSITDVVQVWQYNWQRMHILGPLFNNKIISNSQKKKVWLDFWEVATYAPYTPNSVLENHQKRSFDRYNIPYEYDPERETGTSDTEVEEGEM